MSAAKRIGEELTRGMEAKGLTPRQLAARTGKAVGHIEAVLNGYPNTPPGKTMLDTVDDIAGELGLELKLTNR